MNSCKNCNEPVIGNYCSNCGQPAKLKKIDGQYIIHEIASVFHAERGMLYTLKRMLTSPGESIRQYITEDRSRYVKPITFIFVTSLIYALVNHFFHISAEDFYKEQPEIETPAMNLFLNWMIDNPGYTSLISGLFMAFWVKLFFRKSGYNLFEIFVLLCYIFGISTLFSSVVLIFQGLIHLSLLIQIINIISLIYYTWAIGQFFDKQIIGRHIKAFLSYILGMFIIAVLAVIGTIIEIIIRY